VFGTFITEWDEGKLVRNKLLATMKSARMNAERLAELAVDLGFDGWLVCSLLNFPMLKNLQHVISITFWMCVKILLN
jgi:mannosyl-glycoprotein endo-beta-N-acetylglucosaminidase